MDEPLVFLIAGMASFLGSLFGAWQIVLRSHIVGKVWANIVGVGAVPTALTAAGYYACSLAHPPDPGMPMGVATFTMLGGMIGGWIGAWIGYMTNQQNSADPELQRRFHEAMAQGERASKRRSVGSWLRAGGVPETRGNVWLFQIGAIVASIAFVAVMYRIIDLGLEEPHTLAHLPLCLRLLGAVAPFAGPGLLWVLTRRAVPALGVGLCYALIPWIVGWALVYIVCNLKAVGA